MRPLHLILVLLLAAFAVVRGFDLKSELQSISELMAAKYNASISVAFHTMQITNTAMASPTTSLSLQA